MQEEMPSHEEHAAQESSKPEAEEEQATDVQAVLDEVQVLCSASAGYFRLTRPTGTSGRDRSC